MANVVLYAPFLVSTVIGLEASRAAANACKVIRFLKELAHLILAVCLQIYASFALLAILHIEDSVIRVLQTV
jgi:hypothetical protein